MERTNSSSSEKYEPDLWEGRPLTPKVSATTPRPGRTEAQEQGKERTEQASRRNKERRATVTLMSRTSALVDDSRTAPIGRPDPLARLAAVCKLTEKQKKAVAGNVELMTALQSCLLSGELETTKSGFFSRAPFALVRCLTDEGFTDIAATVLGLCRDPLARLGWVCKLTPTQMNAIAGNADVMAALKSCLQGGTLEVKSSRFLATMPSMALILCLTDEGFDDVAAAVIGRCPKAAVIGFAGDLLERVCKDGWPISPEVVDKCVARAEKLVESMGKAVPQDSLVKLFEWTQAWKFRQPVRFADERKKPDSKLSKDQPAEMVEEGKRAKKAEKGGKAGKKQAAPELPAGCVISPVSYELTIAYSGDRADYPLNALLDYVEAQDTTYAQEQSFGLLKSIFDNAATFKPPLSITDAQMGRATAYLRKLDAGIVLHPQLSDELKLWPKTFGKQYIKACADWVISEDPKQTEAALLILDKKSIQKGLKRSILVCQGKSKFDTAVLLEIAARHAQRGVSVSGAKISSVPTQLAGVCLAAAFHQVHDWVDWQTFNDCFDWVTHGGAQKGKNSWHRNLGHLAASLVAEQPKWEVGIKTSDLVLARGKDQDLVVSTEYMESIAGRFVAMMCTLLEDADQGKAVGFILTLAKSDIPEEVVALLASRLAAGREIKFLKELGLSRAAMDSKLLIKLIGRYSAINLELCKKLIGANLHLLSSGFYVALLLGGALERLTLVPPNETSQQRKERHSQFEEMYKMVETLMSVAGLTEESFRSLDAMRARMKGQNS